MMIGKKYILKLIKIIGKKSNKKGPHTVKLELIDLDEAIKILSGPNVFVIPPPASELD